MAIASFYISSCTSIPKYMSKEEYKALEDGLYANLETSKGDMLVKFFPAEAPMTVGNFIALAEGKKENKFKKEKEPYYDGTIFHRVIKNFMIQGGDPTGTGTGSPGYEFEDEVDNGLKHDKKGILSMANSGPATNGSQFFITQVPTPWLDNKHTIFGEVVKGDNVIDSIAGVETQAEDKPVEDVVLKHVDIIRKGEAFKNYNPTQAFENGKLALQAKIEEQRKKTEMEKEERKNLIKKYTEEAQTTESGLRYAYMEKGDGAKPEKGEDLKVHYTLYLADGNIIDSSHQRNSPLNVKVGQTSLIQGWMEALTMFEKGSKVFLIVPSTLGYGTQGAGPIPANSTLYFEYEPLK